jgi:hypothetical protein
MKKMKAAIVGGLLTVLIIVTATTAMGKDTTLDIERPLGTDPKLYNENPDPFYKGNSELFLGGSSLDAHLVTKEEILTAHEFPEGSTITWLELVTWGEEEKRKQEGRYAIVDMDRLVWVLEADVPNYEHYRFGTIQNAKVHFVYDAETGEGLNSGFTGKPEKDPYPIYENTEKWRLPIPSPKLEDDRMIALKASSEVNPTYLLLKK